MKPRRAKATKAEQERYNKLKGISCIACWVGGYEKVCGTNEIHHFTSGGRRTGNENTIPLGRWHHQGIILPGYTGKQMLREFGPSFGKSRREFESTFGSEEFLLAETNRLLGL